MTHIPRSGPHSWNTPGSMWTQCEAYLDDFQHGTIVVMSGTCGGLTKELMTVVSPLIATSREQLYELSIELDELWPLVQPV